ncbi:MAG: winged helix-turn-helix domain-containing protein [Candidatus Bathyarchaeia archaeon]
MAEEGRRYRTRYDLTAEIIVAAEKPSRPSEIGLQTHLNLPIVNRYLCLLVEVGLIRRVGESLYEATFDGLDYLERYWKLRRLLKVEADDSFVHEDEGSPP